MGTLFLFYKNIFYKNIQLKFAKVKEYFKSKPEVEIVKRI